MTFVLPILLGLASLKWRKTFSLYPAYLLALAHLLALIPWMIFIFLTFGMALLIQGYSYKDAWIDHPWPVTIITIQDALWTFIAPSFFASSLAINSSTSIRHVFAPLKSLSWSKKILFLLLLVFYTLFILFYYLELLSNYGFMIFFGPPS